MLPLAALSFRGCPPDPTSPRACWPGASFLTRIASLQLPSLVSPSHHCFVTLMLPLTLASLRVCPPEPIFPRAREPTTPFCTGMPY